MAVAVVPVRAGALPAGGAEVAAEAGGRVVLVGEGCEVAAKALAGVAPVVETWEAGPYAPAAWAVALAPLLYDAQAVLLPASPDGRDLAPRLAAELRRTLLAGAVKIVHRGKHHGYRVSLARHGGLALEEVVIDEPFVGTLQPGVRGVEPSADAAEPQVVALAVEPATSVPADATIVEVLPPDVATMDLAESPRILGGGAGLTSAERFAQLTRIATALNASMGATRVITDKGWVSHQRQIGTTGVVVAPRLYLAFGISGAVQHTSGLGDPERIISVNTDGHCPMMQMADLAIVSDANLVLDELEKRLSDHG